MKNTRWLVDPIVDHNPVMNQVLGVCSALAVTRELWPALVMSVAVICVLAYSNVAVSLLRRVMPHGIRLILEMTIIASAVIVVDEVLKAYAPGTSRILTVFVGLIVTNCIVLGRAEAFAMHHGPWPSLLDGLGNGLGYTMVLLAVAATRELAGAGTLFGAQVFEPVAAGGWFNPVVLMQKPASAFFVIAVLVWVIRSLRPGLAETGGEPGAWWRAERGRP